jgi:hypothetical protein
MHYWPQVDKWQVLQNCHLAKSFLTQLEITSETQLTDEAIDRNFLSGSIS